ncbi:biotinidase isoform X1 [Neodiprion lecontei]|uniref:Biotinidase isoform X1 n=1 Tax=Neodiprion lecontei TaxID=441921 RepID=A0A6J0BUI6_NEOLC|nr:biotinidase isoform X1 [Neodiprion lecontei]
MMEFLIRPLLLILLIAQMQSAQDSYKAATFEYEPEYIPDDPLETMRLNAKEFEKQIEIVSKEYAKIIVFPELGLTSIHLPNRSALSNWSIEVPDPEKNSLPCNESGIHEVLHKISCAAERRKLYVVINLVEKKDNCLYSSNVVFSSEGRIVARYRKYYRYNEFGEFNRPKELNATAFSTPFGTFGVLIGADILYEEPARTLIEKNVRQFVYPLAWVTVLPFSTSYQMQLTWSKTKDVTVISAPYYPGREYVVGGIFMSAGYDPKAARLNSAIVDIVPRKGRVSIDEISQSVTEPIGNDCVVRNKDIKLKYANITPFTNKIDNDTSQWTWEADGIKCEFEVTANLSARKTESFQFFAYTGKDDVLGEKCSSFATSVCAIVRCGSNSLDKCGLVGTSRVTFSSIKIKTTYNQTKHELVFQNTLQHGYYEIPSTMNSTNSTGKMIQTMVLSSEAQGLVVFGIVRKFFLGCTEKSNDTADNYVTLPANTNDNPDNCSPLVPDLERDLTSPIYPYIILCTIFPVVLFALVYVAIKYRRQILSRITD